MTLFEVCVDDAAGLATAIAGGADRIELCASLELGGLTPSPGLVALAQKSPIPVRAMIRPRAGDFVFAEPDIETMLAEIAAMRAAGLEGVVLGASLSDGSLDIATLQRLVSAASGLKLTLHRAFDLVPDLPNAIETAIALAFDTILTSGRALNAMAGLGDIVTAHRLADGRLTIMAGSGVSADNAAAILAAAPLGALHGSCSVPAAPASATAARLGFESPGRKSTDLGKVRAMKTVITNPSA